MYASVCFNVVVVFWQGKIRNNESADSKTVPDIRTQMQYSKLAQTTEYLL